MWCLVPAAGVHQLGCGSCLCKPVVGLRYQCVQCPKLHLCQVPSACVHTPRTLCPYVWAAAVVAVSLESPVVQQASVHDPCVATDTHCQGSTIRLPSWTGSVCGPALPTLHSPPCTPHRALPTLHSPPSRHRQLLAAVPDGFIWYFLFEASGCHTCPLPSLQQCHLTGTAATRVRGHRQDHQVEEHQVRYYSSTPCAMPHAWVHW